MCFLLLAIEMAIPMHRSMSYWTLYVKDTRVQVVLVDDSKLIMNLDVKMVGIHKIDMYLLCKGLGCCFWWHTDFSTLYLMSHTLVRF